MIAHVARIFENCLRTGCFEFTARHSAAEHGDCRHTGALARLDVLHRVADEDRVVGVHTGVVEGDLHDVGLRLGRVDIIR